MLGASIVNNAILSSIYNQQRVISYYDKFSNFGIMRSEAWLVERYLQDHHRLVLDLGCGAGRTLEYFTQFKVETILGLDISAGMLSAARKRNVNAKLVQADACALPLGDETVDLITFFFNGLMVIPGRNNRLKALIELRRVLTPRGIAILSSPLPREFGNVQNVNDRLFRTQNINASIEEGDRLLEEEMGYTFVHVPKNHEMEDLIGASGLALIECYDRLEINNEIEEFEDHLDLGVYWIVSRKDSLKQKI